MLRDKVQTVVEVTQVIPYAVQLVISYKYLQFDVTYDPSQTPIPIPMSGVQDQVAVHVAAATPKVVNGMRKLLPGELSSMCGFKFWKSNERVTDGTWRRRR
jgi:hypothetical protein